jgi:hypothetical protein
MPAASQDDKEVPPPWGLNLEGRFDALQTSLQKISAEQRLLEREVKHPSNEEAVQDSVRKHLVGLEHSLKRSNRVAKADQARSALTRTWLSGPQSGGVGWMGGWITSLDDPQVWFILACIGGGLAQVIYKIFKHAVYGDRFKVGSQSLYEIVCCHPCPVPETGDGVNTTPPLWYRLGGDHVCGPQSWLASVEDSVWPTVLAGVGGGLALQVYMRGLGWFWGPRVVVEVLMICAGGLMGIMPIVSGVSFPICSFQFHRLGVFIMCAGVFAMGQGAVYNVYLFAQGLDRGRDGGEVKVMTVTRA